MKCRDGERVVFFLYFILLVINEEPPPHRQEMVTGTQRGCLGDIGGQLLPRTCCGCSEVSPSDSQAARSSQHRLRPFWSPVWEAEF